jgi:hypothetical protein
MHGMPAPSSLAADPRPTRDRGAGETPRRGRLRGGPDGNEQLTAMTGVVLLVLLAVLGVTIVRIGQMISVHLFLGLLLVGPVGLKMASTGYRFVRYYTRNPVYRGKGPPDPLLRVIAPIVVLTTIVVFVSGVILLFQGPAQRDTLVAIHKVSFIVWLVFTALHVLGHLPGLPTALRAASGDRARIAGHDTGNAGRTIALVGALVGGVVLAIVLIPDFASWTASNSLFHHHGG